MRPSIILLAAAVSWPLAAQEYKPFPQAKITAEQWKGYFEEVSRVHSAERREVPEQKVVLFVVEAKGTNYAFTQQGHPAHPAWITRRVEQDAKGVYVAQIGYFAGTEPAFARMFREYQSLDDKMREEFVKRHGKGK